MYQFKRVTKQPPRLRNQEKKPEQRLNKCRVHLVMVSVHSSTIRKRRGKKDYGSVPGRKLLLIKNNAKAFLTFSEKTS